jgi:hypothetical protein
MYSYGLHNVKTFDAGGSFVLDEFPTAAFAKSYYRKLNSAYAGSAFRAYNETSTVEQDIGFDAGLMDEASLTTFAGANSVKVTKGYDQSGNAVDAIQAVVANMPRIVTTGTTNKHGIYPFVDAISGDSKMDIALAGNTNFWAFAIIKADNLSMFISNNAGDKILGTTQAASSSSAFTLTSPTFYKNGVDASILTRANMYDSYNPAWCLLTLQVDTSTMTEYKLGFVNTFSMFDTSELLIYHRDMTSEKAALEARLMTDYGII